MPHEFTHKIARKMQASREVWGEIIGTINTREKFEDHRIVLARREWERMEANDSRECRVCHDYKDMDISLMRPTSQVAMRAAAKRDESCISCHKGIAHHLPDLKGEHNPACDICRCSADPVDWVDLGGSQGDCAGSQQRGPAGGTGSVA